MDQRNIQASNHNGLLKVALFCEYRTSNDVMKNDSRKKLAISRYCDGHKSEEIKAKAVYMESMQRPTDYF